MLSWRKRAWKIILNTGPGVKNKWSYTAIRFFGEDRFKFIAPHAAAAESQLGFGIVRSFAPNIVVGKQFWNLRRKIAVAKMLAYFVRRVACTLFYSSSNERGFHKGRAVQRNKGF
jgi:hypothetical protein